MASTVLQHFEGKIDFEGQKKVERITHFSLTAITVLSFVLGFSLQSLQVTFTVFGASMLLLVLIIVPPWPAYNKHPIKWLPNSRPKKGQ